MVGPRLLLAVLIVGLSPSAAAVSVDETRVEVGPGGLAWEVAGERGRLAFPAPSRPSAPSGGTQYPLSPLWEAVTHVGRAAEAARDEVEEVHEVTCDARPKRSALSCSDDKRMRPVRYDPWEYSEDAAENAENWIEAHGGLQVPSAGPSGGGPFAGPARIGGSLERDGVVFAPQRWEFEVPDDRPWWATDRAASPETDVFGRAPVLPHEVTLSTPEIAPPPFGPIEVVAEGITVELPAPVPVPPTATPRPAPPARVAPKSSDDGSDAWAPRAPDAASMLDATVAISRVAPPAPGDAAGGVAWPGGIGAAGGVADAVRPGLHAGLVGIFLLPLWRLYRYLRDDEVLANVERRRVFEAVRREPGITPGELRRLLAVHYTTVQHHLRILEERGHVVGRRMGGRIRCFVAGGPVGSLEKRLLAVARTPTAFRLLELARSEPGISSREAARRLGTSESTTREHAARLAGFGLVLRGPAKGLRVSGPVAEALARLDARASSDD
ncbi:MAG: winged helix-turn-helix transcriptional regulator [Methanobacteriota archaeon]